MPNSIIHSLINGEKINLSQIPRIENASNLKHYLTDLETVTLTSGKTITFPKYLDGGGGIYKKYILDAVGDKKYTHAFEWCAGHGEIGFELITNDICQTLTFLDCYDRSTEWCVRNAQELGISDRVEAITSSIIGNAPFQHRFDLVVGNPPNAAGMNMTHIQKYLVDEDDNQFIHWHRINNDLNFEAHREFFDSLYKFITNHADILLTINIGHEQHFRSLGKTTGFQLVKIIDMFPDDPHLKIFHFKPF